MHFDKAFIPTWYYVGLQNVDEAKSSVFYLSFEWQQLENRYGKHLPGDEDWQETFRRVNDWLDEAFRAIDGNCFELAYNQLDHVRYEMMDLRRRHQIDYYLDYLFDFEDTMNEVLEVANDDMLCLMEWNEFESLVHRMNAQWQRALRQEIDGELFKLDPLKLRHLQSNQQLVTSELQAFDEAMKTGDQCEVILAGESLRPAYMQVLTKFGNFNWEKQAGLN